MVADPEIYRHTKLYLGLNAQDEIEILNDSIGRTWGFDLLEPLTEDFLTSREYWAQQKFITI